MKTGVVFFTLFFALLSPAIAGDGQSVKEGFKEVHKGMKKVTRTVDKNAKKGVRKIDKNAKKTWKKAGHDIKQAAN